MMGRSDFRAALGQFATGVTVVTTTGRWGEPIGVTANSFTAVSLDPPLILWCQSRHAPAVRHFTHAPCFAVNVLAADQDHLARRFAGPAPDKFAGLDASHGPHGMPLLGGTVARFLCRAMTTHDGGDHVIHVGEVESYERSDGEPLVFHAGRYHSIGPETGGSSMTSTTSPSGWAYTRLVKVHNGIRADLDLLRRAGAAVTDADDSDAATAFLAQLALRNPQWTLSRFCAGVCGFVHEHHATEDEVFPRVLETVDGSGGELAAVVEKLTADHRTLSALLDEVEQAFARLPGDAAAKSAAAAAIATLALHLETHLAYEEAALESALNQFSRIVPESSVPPPPQYGISAPAPD
jgi:flavin reductase (DIM6/NTAB) family NADH-FMN oxidoreductase RutF